ncbi:MAG: GIY-YIG nuclease family protein [Bacteroidales bacterium]|nr:GIY-YIG nuclease family protein [Bacteroidales bacterium]
METYFTYIARCADGTLYTGWTTNLVRRIAAHNGSGAAGAKYTKTRRPVTLVFAERHTSKSEAMSREWHIKRLSRKEKLRLIGWEKE